MSEVQRGLASNKKLPDKLEQNVSDTAKNINTINLILHFASVWFSLTSFSERIRFQKSFSKIDIENNVF